MWCDGNHENDDLFSPPERVHNHEGQAPIAVPAHTLLNKGRKRSANPPAVIAILFLNVVPLL